MLLVLNLAITTKLHPKGYLTYNKYWNYELAKNLKNMVR